MRRDGGRDRGLCAPPVDEQDGVDGLLVGGGGHVQCAAPAGVLSIDKGGEALHQGWVAMSARGEGGRGHEERGKGEGEGEK